jgi:oligopeptide/dipeptide ABC transporter ATP-binding protein
LETTLSSPTASSTKSILSIEDAKVTYPVNKGVVRALDGVSLDVKPGEIVAVVGESGCGKTTLAKAVLGLQKLADGQILLNDTQINGTRKGMAAHVGMVWQDPYASLNPRWTVARSLEEPAKLVGRKIDVKEVFEMVGLDERFMDRFPHQLSGGQRQRVAIGRALALQPPLVICDEPTSALDLSIRAQILNLLKDLRSKLGCAFLYISHDLTTVRFLADRVAVMYLGRIVEEGLTEAIFSDPRHPYTKALMDSAPTLDKLMYLPDPVEGEMPNPTEEFVGCRFAGRCPYVSGRCRETDPEATTDGNHRFYCHHPLTIQVQ